MTAHFESKQEFLFWQATWLRFPLQVCKIGPMTSIFTRIINRELPAKIFYETDEVIVIQDIYPKAPLHLLIIPKQESRNFYETDPATLAMLDETVKTVAKKLGLEDRFRVQINNGYGQEIDHLHYHFMSDEGADRVTFIES